MICYNYQHIKTLIQNHSNQKKRSRKMKSPIRHTCFDNANINQKQTNRPPKERFNIIRKINNGSLHSPIRELKP